MNTDDQVEAVKEYLIYEIERHIGEEHAIKQGDLLKAMHSSLPMSRDIIPNTRSLLTMIHDLRRSGIVIASGARGYHKPATAKEAHIYLETVLKSRAMDLLQTVRAQKRAIWNEYGRQLQMDEPK